MCLRICHRPINLSTDLSIYLSAKGLQYPKDVSFDVTRRTTGGGGTQGKEKNDDKNAVAKRSHSQ